MRHVMSKVHHERSRPPRTCIALQRNQATQTSPSFLLPYIFLCCRAPISNERLMLRGINAFDAATHCAAISAAERMRGTTIDFLEPY